MVESEFPFGTDGIRQSSTHRSSMKSCQLLKGAMHIRVFISNMEENGMSELILANPVELTDAELDLVTGGLAVAAGGLVNLALSTGNIDVLRNADIDVLSGNDVTLKDILNNNQLSLGAIIQVLGGGAAILQRQTM